jgi:hypothetical protein
MKGQIGIVACDVVSDEIRRVIDGRDIPLKVLEFALHTKPSEMPGAISRAVKELTAGGLCQRVALGYGLCSNGTAGLSCSGGLTMPRCHDCVSMLLGSPVRYMKLFTENPGTMWITDGGIRNVGDPLTVYETRYKPRMGAKKALKGISLEFANYTHFCFINNGIGNIEELRRLTRESAKFLGKEFREVEADLSYFRSLVDGPWPEENFLVLGPGEKVDESHFYRHPKAVLAAAGGK